MHEHDRHSHVDEAGQVHEHRPLDYAASVAEERQAKDAFFRESHHSPIPPGERARFAGLGYYPIDIAYRFERLRLQPLAAGLQVETQVQTSDGAVRDGSRVGTFVFEVEGHEEHLTALQLAGNRRGVLFVPFRDATSGIETYASGRYLDLEASPDGTYDLDFNLAYSPFCAYSPSYSCPLPPPENRLTVRILAGERGL